MSEPRDLNAMTPEERELSLDAPCTHNYHTCPDCVRFRIAQLKAADERAGFTNGFEKGHEEAWREVEDQRLKAKTEGERAGALFVLRKWWGTIAGDMHGEDAAGDFQSLVGVTERWLGKEITDYEIGKKDLRDGVTLEAEGKTDG